MTSKAVACGVAISLCVSWSASATETVSLTVRETAGIRRFGYPVSAKLRLDHPVPDTTRFRLLEKSQPIVAQFRPVVIAGSTWSHVALDFDANFLPDQSREYTIEFGLDVVAGPEPNGGMRIDDGEASFKVSNGTFLAWHVGKDLAGLLQAVNMGETQFLRPDSAGLTVHKRDGTKLRLGGLGADCIKMQGSAIKHGPIDCALRFESQKTQASDQGSIRTTVELDFPRSKSWVMVSCRVGDPNGEVSALSAELNLDVSGDPTLVDFGAGSLVYAALRKDQQAAMLAGSASGTSSAARKTWRVLRGTAGQMEPYVSAPRHDATPVEGWAHIMDDKRCTAAAVDNFARTTHDRIEIAASGTTVISREFADADTPPQAGEKLLTFWLHFVTMPVHVGAATSPQSMQSPLEVTWQKR